jgi:type VI secretion system protein ImpK
MSSDDKNRTVIRPSPLRKGGGGAGSPAAGGGFPPAGGGTGAGGGMGGGGWGDPPPPPPPPPPGGPFGDQPGPERGFIPSRDPGMPEPGQGMPHPPGGAVSSAVAFQDTVPAPADPPSHRNILTAHASPVLAMAAALQSGRWRIPLDQFRLRAREEILKFDQEIQKVCSPRDRQIAKYAVCATVDDIAQNIPGVNTTQYAQQNMGVTFFGESIAGERFWQFVEEILRDPAQYRDMIELFHACLAAGFEGEARAIADGQRRKQNFMERLYGAMQHVRSLSQSELVGHWAGENAPRQVSNFWSVILFSAAGAAALSFAIFVLFFVTLMFTGEDAHANVDALFPDQPLALVREAPPLPAPPSSTETRLREFLAEEIAAGLVEVEGNRVRTTVGTLFEPASEALVAGRESLFTRIGRGIELEEGPVLVEGHADSDRIATLQFPDNYALSEARAKTIGGIIRGQLTDPARVTEKGMGDAVPIASNDTPEGKARNRRVEIVVQLGN